MTVTEALNNRFSCRVFSDKAVTQDILEAIFADAFRTPSCENSQPWEVYVAGTEAMKRLCMEYENFRKDKKPADLSNRFNGRWTDEMTSRIDKELPDWSLFDTGMFAQSLMLSAAEHGLATMAISVLSRCSM